MWAGISEGGFATVVFHLDSEKLCEEDWVDAVDSGKLVEAIKSLKPVRRNGPWTVLCDNESFLRTKDSRAAYRRAKVKLWGVPPKSPDLNPVDFFWSWLRRRLRALDLADLQKKRRPLGKTAYVARVRSVCRSAKAQTVAKNCARNLRKTCQQVIKKRGGGTRG